MFGKCVLGLDLTRQMSIGLSILNLGNKSMLKYEHTKCKNDRG